MSYFCLLYSCINVATPYKHAARRLCRMMAALVEDLACVTLNTFSQISLIYWHAVSVGLCSILGFQRLFLMSHVKKLGLLQLWCCLFFLFDVLFLLLLTCNLIIFFMCVTERSLALNTQI